MEGPAFSPRPEAADSRRAHPIVEGPRLADIVFEIGVVLALHLAAAFAVVMTLRSFGIA
jgi:hypothetical protein